MVKHSKDHKWQSIGFSNHKSFEDTKSYTEFGEATIKSRIN